MEKEKLIERAVRTLITELGPVETVRFINLSRKKRMESVKRHRSWQKSLKKEDFFNEIF